MSRGAMGGKGRAGDHGESGCVGTYPKRNARETQAAQTASSGNRAFREPQDAPCEIQATAPARARVSPMVICGIDLRGSGVSEASGTLRVAVSGQLCREMLREMPEESTVLVGDAVADVSAINLAAAIKGDSPGRRVVLACDSVTGSLMSRVQTAGIDEVVGHDEAIAMIRRLEAIESIPKTQAPQRRGAPVSVPSIVRDAPVSSFLTVVTSGRGGVGRSTIAMCMAICAARIGARVALVDLDSQFGDMGLLCSADPDFDRLDIDVSSGRGAGELSQPAAGRVLLVRSSAPPEYCELSQQALAEAVPAISDLSDLVVVSVGPHWADAHASVIELAGSVVMLMDQRTSSVAGCKTALGLCVRLGIPSSRITFALNRCSKRMRITSVDCAMALGVSEVIEIEDGGDEVEDCMSVGRPSALLAGQGRFVQSVEELLAHSVPGLELPRAEARSKRERQVGTGLMRGLFGKASM